MSKVNLKNGRFDGKFIRWWENGQKHQEKNYKDGILDGKWTDWWADGSTYFEKNYKDGKKDGKWIEWHKNGQIKIDSNYKDGKLDGKYTQWYENGQKDGEGNYIDGKSDGKWTMWFPNGQISQEKFVKDGKKDGKWIERGITGKLIRESEWKDGECISGDWCADKLESEIELDSALIVNEEQQKKNELEAERAAEQLAFEKEQYNRLLTQEIQAEQDLARTLIIEDQLNTLKTVYVNNIAARAKQHWRYQGAEDDWGCEVYVLQDIDGTVQAVNVQNCNFDDSEKARAFKNSIERAIYRASPFPIAPDDAVFSREILFYFRAD
jgi:antitoxin component YwqK of YwqJK toxin-antitoxin module